MKKWYSFSIIMISLILIIACSTNTNNADTTATVSSTLFSVDIDPTQEFLKDSTVIHQWIAQDNQEAIAEHAWHIWKYVTEETGEKDKYDNPIRRFEAWVTDFELSALANSTDPVAAYKNMERGHRGQIDIHTQHFHESVLASSQSDMTVLPSHEYVKYNYHASIHTLENGLFKKDVLNDYIAKGQKDIPDFPSAAVVVKPTFVHVPAEEVEKQTTYPIYAWPGEIKGNNVAFPPNEWNNYAFIDFTNQSGGNGNTSSDPEKQCEGCVYNLNDFVHWRLSQADVDYHNGQIQRINFNRDGKDEPVDPIQVKAGDYMILMAMHVTTRETKRWTWQTYWWTPTPDSPKTPSTSLAAKTREGIVSGAPAHYAVSIAYDMIRPEGTNKLTPYTNGDGKGEPIYAYNPYLEAKFPHLALHKDTVPAIQAKGKVIMNTKGMQSNCMSCHGRANQSKNIFGFIADTYIDFGKDQYYGVNANNAEKFQLFDLYNTDSYVRTDFLWSIPFIVNGMNRTDKGEH